MKRYLFDTASANDYIHRRQGLVEKAKEREAWGDKIGICVPVLGDLWAGVDLSSAPEKTKEELVLALKAFKIWPYTEEAVKEYGRLFAVLRKKKALLQPLTIQIAAIALSMGHCVVVSKDPYFSEIPDLALENWAA